MGLDLLMNPKVTEDEPPEPSAGAFATILEEDDGDEEAFEDEDDEEAGGMHGHQYAESPGASEADDRRFEEEEEEDQEDERPPSPPPVARQANARNARRIPKPSYVPPPGASAEDIKRDLLYQFDRLQKKGYKVHRRFSMASSLEDMHAEYERIVRDKKTDASIRMQQNCLMGFVNLVEMMDGRFFDLELDGWAESVHSNINDYDDTFEELAVKYSGTGHIAPEFRLIFMVLMSGFTFHMSKRLAKSIPGVGAMFEHNPALKKQFASTAASMMQNGSNRMAGGGRGQAERDQADPMASVMKMFGGMFGDSSAPGGEMRGPSASAAPEQPRPPQAKQQPVSRASAETVKSFVKSRQGVPDTLEVMSQSDTSEISEVLSIGSSKKTGGRKPARTLNL